MKRDNHIFGIEGEWDNDFKENLTIKSSLTLLKEVCNIEYIFRKTNTVNSLLSYLKASSKSSYKKYGTIVIATHGTRNDIEVSKNENITIEELTDECKNLFEGKIVHFSSCGVMQNEKGVFYFKEMTSAKAVCGYTKEIDFLESSIFDIALLQKLFEFDRIGNVNNYLKRKHSFLYKELGFKMI